MATMTAIRALPEISSERRIRTQMEELLFDFYSVVGVAPRRPYPVMANDLLSDNFVGRFFIATTSELMCFNKAQMLAAKVGRGDMQRPCAQLLSMNLLYGADGSMSVNYAAAFRYGQTAMIRRGALKAVEGAHGWALRSVDEDVRVIVLAESKRKLSAKSDRPRIWIL